MKFYGKTLLTPRKIVLLLKNKLLELSPKIIPIMVVYTTLNSLKQRCSTTEKHHFPAFFRKRNNTSNKR